MKLYSLYFRKHKSDLFVRESEKYFNIIQELYWLFFFSGRNKFNFNSLQLISVFFGLIRCIELKTLLSIILKTPSFSRCPDVRYGPHFTLEHLPQNWWKQPLNLWPIRMDELSEVSVSSRKWWQREKLINDLRWPVIWT